MAMVDAVVAELRTIGEKHGGKTPSQVALNWVMAKGAVPIPGAKSRPGPGERRRPRVADGRRRPGGSTGRPPRPPQHLRAGSGSTAEPMEPARLAQQERGVVCDLFVEFGPDAPTLCEGWSTTDLAAHLVVRERRPDSGPGLVWPPLSDYTDKVRRTVRDRTSWTELVDRVRPGPPALLRPFDGPMNTVEYFIHAEDVRRAQPGWEPRPLSPELADALWARVGPEAWPRRWRPPSGSLPRGGRPRSRGADRSWWWTVIPAS